MNDYTGYLIANISKLIVKDNKVDTFTVSDIYSNPNTIVDYNRNEILEGPYVLTNNYMSRYCMVCFKYKDILYPKTNRFQSAEYSVIFTITNWVPELKGKLVEIYSFMSGDEVVEIDGNVLRGSWDTIIPDVFTKNNIEDIKEAMNKYMLKPQISENVNYDNIDQVNDLMSEYYTTGMGSYRRFDYVPAEVLKVLIDNDYIHGDLSMNDSPTFSDIYDFIKKHEGFTVGGMMFAPDRNESGRISHIEYNGPYIDAYREDFIDFAKTADEVDTEDRLFAWWD